jgi:hypothetical protein
MSKEEIELEILVKLEETRIPFYLSSLGFLVFHFDVIRSIIPHLIPCLSLISFPY